MPDRRLLGEALHDERKGEPLRPSHAAARVHDLELGNVDAVIGEDRLGERLVARQHEAARIAAGVRHAQELEVARNVLVELPRPKNDSIRLKTTCGFHSNSSLTDRARARP
jgi:hypothetical protein